MMLPLDDANWQLLLHLIRLIFLVPLIILWCLPSKGRAIMKLSLTGSGPPKHFDITEATIDIGMPMGGYWPIFLTAVIWTCLNDVYMLTWDTYTHGSILASVIPQIFISLYLMISSSLLGALLAIALRQDFPPMLPSSPVAPWVTVVLIILCIICAILLVIHITLWIKAPPGAFRRGVKDLQDQSGGISLFGWRRSPGQLRRAIIWGRQGVFRLIFRSLPTWLKNIVFRRIDGVESQRFAATRNVTAILLLSILVGRSVVLFRDVIYEDFSNREIWVHINKFQPTDTVGMCIIYANGTSQFWTAHFIVGMSKIFNSSTDNVISGSEIQCFDSHYFDYSTGLQLCLNQNSLRDAASMDMLDVVLTANTSSSTGMDLPTGPGRIWIGYPDLYSGIDVLFDPGIQLIPSWHLFGLIEITIHRTIVRSFSGMLGFSEDYTDLSMTSIGETDRVEQRICRASHFATLSLSGDASGKVGDKPALVRIVQEYRQHTFLGALSSIGGLLAVLQGFHLLCFGRPLFWGLFGSKLLDPFGAFGRFSDGLAKRSVAQYGFTPGGGFSTVHGLGLFLSDFVIDIAPLGEESDRDDSVESQGLGGNDISSRSSSSEAMALGVNGEVEV